MNLHAERRGHYNFFRDYDPKSGRYLEADPIGQLGGANLYGYAASNPLNVADPSGLTVGTLVGRVLRRLAPHRIDDADFVGFLAGSEVGFLSALNFTTGLDPSDPRCSCDGTFSNTAAAQIGLTAGGSVDSFRAAAALTRLGGGAAVLGVPLAGVTGFELGSAFNQAVLCSTGQLPADFVFDWLENIKAQLRQD